MVNGLNDADRAAVKRYQVVFVPMKSFFCSLIFVALAVLFFTACSGVSSSQPEKANGSKPGAVNKGDGTKPQNSEYPLLTEKITQAEIEMLDGSTAKISDRKGKVVLLNLWGTWCGPCRGEIPQLVEMQEKYRDKGFEVLGLDIGEQDGTPETVEDITSFAEAFKINYDLARISNELSAEFSRVTKFNGVPQTILIDREGRMRGVFLGGGPRVIGQMKETVDKVVNE